MNILEFLDRIGERRAARPIRPPRDIRQFIGAMFLAGYYVMVFRLSQQSLPPNNIDLIRDAMLTLGPPIGIIIGAMFRTDAREEQQTANTGEALRTIGKVAQAGQGGIGAPAGTDEDPLKTEIVNAKSNPANVKDAKK